MKQKLPIIKKYILIPLALCVLVTVAGIIMTITGSSSIGREAYTHSISSRSMNYPITGPQVIVIGVLVIAFVIFIWIKRDK